MTFFFCLSEPNYFKHLDIADPVGKMCFKLNAAKNNKKNEKGYFA